MKGKKYSIEDKIGILRQADGGWSILEVCREENILEVTFHRWKNQFGQMEVSEAKRSKELEREHGVRRCWPKACSRIECWRRCAKKSYKPGAATAGRSGSGSRPAVFRACGGPVFEDVEVDVLVSKQRANEPGTEAAQAADGAKRKAWPLRVSANRRLAAAGGLASRKKTRAAVAKDRSGCECRPPSARWCVVASPRGCRRRPSTGAMSGAGTSSRMPPREAEPCAC